MQHCFFCDKTIIVILVTVDSLHTDWSWIYLSRAYHIAAWIIAAVIDWNKFLRALQQFLSCYSVDFIKMWCNPSRNHNNWIITVANSIGKANNSTVVFLSSLTISQLATFPSALCIVSTILHTLVPKWSYLWRLTSQRIYIA